MKRHHKISRRSNIEYDEDRLQSLSLDTLLDLGASEEPTAILRRVIERRKEGDEHPELGIIRYEYEGRWIGHRVVGGHDIEFEILGSSDGPDPIVAGDVARAMNGFKSLWNDALSFIHEEADHFDLKAPIASFPIKVIGHYRKGTKTSITIELYVVGSNRTWWIEFEDGRAESFGYYLPFRKR